MRYVGPANSNTKKHNFDKKYNFIIEDSGVCQ